MKKKNSNRIVTHTDFDRTPHSILFFFFNLVIFVVFRSVLNCVKNEKNIFFGSVFIEFLNCACDERNEFGSIQVDILYKIWLNFLLQSGVKVMRCTNEWNKYFI